MLPATPWAERPGRDNRPAHENAHRHDGARLESRRDHEIRLAPFNSRRNGLGIEFRSDNRCKSNFQYPDSRPVANLQDTETGYQYVGKSFFLFLFLRFCLLGPNGKYMFFIRNPPLLSTMVPENPALITIGSLPRNNLYK